MEPQIKDYYNEFPDGINVIDKMNEELDEAQKEIEELKLNQKTKEEKNFMKKFQMPRIKVDSFEEYKEKENKLEEFNEYIKNIMIDDNFNTRYEKLELEFHNYGLSDDIHHGPGLVEDPDAIIYKIIDKLDDLTDNLNKEWCEKRILTSIETCINLKDAHCGYHHRLENIISEDEGWRYLPTVYFELSLMNTFKDEDHCDNQQILSLANIWYYDCEKCGKSSTYGDFEDVDNKLLCGDCNWDHNHED